jgi:hypothetical protein
MIVGPEPDDALNPALSDPAGYKRHMNNLMHESLEHEGETSVGFFCECPSTDCFQAVWLSAGAFGTARGNPEWSVLAPGHAVPPVAQGSDDLTA